MARREFLSGAWNFFGNILTGLNSVLFEIIAFVVLTFQFGVSWRIIVSFLLGWISLFTIVKLVYLWCNVQAAREALANMGQFIGARFVKVDIDEFKGLIRIAKPRELASMFGRALQQIADRSIRVIYVDSSEAEVCSNVWVTCSGLNHSFIFMPDELKRLTGTQKFLATHEYFHGFFNSRYAVEFKRRALLSTIFLYPLVLAKIDLTIVSVLIIGWLLAVVLLLKGVVYPSLVPAALLMDEVQADKFAFMHADQSWLKYFNVESLLRTFRDDGNLTKHDDLIKQRESVFRETLARFERGTAISTLERSQIDGSWIGPKGHWLTGTVGLCFVILGFLPGELTDRRMSVIAALTASFVMVWLAGRSYFSILLARIDGQLVDQ